MRTFLVCVFAFAVATTALAGNRELPIRDVTVITDGEGSARILFRIGDLSLGNQSLIRRATLTVPHVGPVADRHAELRIHPVSTSWSRGAVWNSGWQRAGGDFNEDLYAAGRLDLRNTQGTASFDLTVILKELLEEGTFADGFLLTVAESELDGIRTEDIIRFSNLGQATVSFSTLGLPSRGPPEARARRNR